jgi:hypothetical protein
VCHTKHVCGPRVEHSWLRVNLQVSLASDKREPSFIYTVRKGSANVLRPGISVCVIFVSRSSA